MAKRRKLYGYERGSVSRFVSGEAEAAKTIPEPKLIEKKLPENRMIRQAREPQPIYIHYGLFTI